MLPPPCKNVLPTPMMSANERSPHRCHRQHEVGSRIWTNQCTPRLSWCRYRGPWPAQSRTPDRGPAGPRTGSPRRAWTYRTNSTISVIESENKCTKLHPSPLLNNIVVALRWLIAYWSYFYLDYTLTECGQTMTVTKVFSKRWQTRPIARFWGANAILGGKILFSLYV